MGDPDPEVHQAGTGDDAEPWELTVHRAQALLSTLRETVTVIDTHGRILYTNRALDGILGYELTKNFENSNAGATVQPTRLHAEPAAGREPNHVPAGTTCCGESAEMRVIFAGAPGCSSMTSSGSPR